MRSYVLTLFIPTLLVWLVGDSLFENPNQIIHAGLFGNVLTPFFLGIFAVSEFPSLITFFAAFSVFSITVPTAIYLFLLIAVNVSYRFYQQYWVEKSGLLLRFATMFKGFGEYLMMLGSALMALTFVL